MAGTIRKGTDFIIVAVELQFLAKKHFAEGSSERRFLMELAESLDQTYLLHHYLKRIQQHVDRVFAVNVPDEKTVIHLSHYLENIADTLEKWTYTDEAKAAKQASALLHIWYDQYLTIELLMQASKDLRFIGGQPAGSA
jgi:hypothetical protein